MTAVRIQPFDNLQTTFSEINEAVGRRADFRKTPAAEITDGRYAVRFARTTAEIDAALRLRYAVFNVELREGLETSYITGLDEDKFDAVCHHLIVTEKESNAVVGTYRLQTLEMARSVNNFYCAGEFALEDLPPQVLSESVEIGRACVAAEHRSSRVLFLLWKGLTAFAASEGKRYLFGCCSLTSQNMAEGWRAAREIERAAGFHADFLIAPRSDFACETEDSAFPDNAQWNLPKLFTTYLRFGAKVCSPPAIDREFKTIDFFVMFDFEAMDDKIRRLLTT